IRVSKAVHACSGGYDVGNHLICNPARGNLGGVECLDFAEIWHSDLNESGLLRRAAPGGTSRERPVRLLKIERNRHRANGQPRQQKNSGGRAAALFFSGTLLD
ncbi:MAG: hypothetical protein ACUVRZ_10790, partial [Desulfobacca sp.]|uniref:hypothetical protein n=1 Tax=Desulfobacca sp. TaxID=2067990 RepID=UPI00404B9D12